MSNKILVVDDETEISDLIEVYLKNENYTVFKFYTAQEALNCIETTPIDLAILDRPPNIQGHRLPDSCMPYHKFQPECSELSKLPEEKPQAKSSQGGRKLPQH